MPRILIPTAILALLAASTGRAQDAHEGLALSDTLFVQAAAASGMGEVVVSELGEQKASDPKLKEFSRKAAADHSKLNQEMAALASQKGIPLPQKLDARAQFCSHSLSGAPQDDFDRCYAAAQLVIHLEAVGAFEAEIRRGRDPEVKALASKALPVIKEHLHMIKPIAARFMKEHEEESGKGR